MVFFHLILLITGILLTGSGLVVARVSAHEGEHVAARRAMVAALVAGILTAGIMILCWSGIWWPGWIFLAGFFGGTVILILPFPHTPPHLQDEPTGKIDERAIMFSRAALDPGTARFEAYYADYPEHRKVDDQWRKLAGLLSDHGGKFEPFAFAAAKASFSTVELLAELVQGQPETPCYEFDPAVAAAFYKGWAKKLGAVSCGVTALKPEHIYSIKGRGKNYGQPIVLDHPYAIVLTVEMDHGQLGRAPEGPTIMESAQQYLASGAIAVQIAESIRNLGWEAEAHIDANYKVVCPLVARDAGLGEIGRMGLLMTPMLGPRVRLAVVTTNLPLQVDTAKRDPTVLDFCRICRKCADGCPAGAIPGTDPVPVQGALRWQIDQEKCYTYWCAVGTDCGRCIRVCPYAHPDNAMHRLVRKLLRRSGLFRRFALAMDDLLYGRDPAPLPQPSWLPARRRVDGTSVDR